MRTVAITLPDIGEGIAEAELVEVHVKVGDYIAEEEVIAEVMTDKATVEVPSSQSGKVVWVGGVVGDTLAIGADLIRLQVAGAEEATEVAAAGDTQDAAPAPQDPTAAPPQSPVSGSRPLAAPAVRKAALDRGIDLRLVPGTGPAGRILHSDLAAFAAEDAPSPPSGTTQMPIVGLRKRIAERMEAAKARTPHMTIVEEVDVTELLALRQSLNNANPPVRLTLLPFVVRALVPAVAAFPEMNAHFDEVRQLVTSYADVHVGVATQTADGLLVPVLRQAQALSLAETAQALSRLVQAARDGKATSEELSGSTITISSLGTLGGLVTTPILNRPEVAIIGINKIAKRPLWNGEEFLPRDVMNLSCSFDHRIIDGWNAAQFIQALRERLEAADLASLEP